MKKIIFSLLVLTMVFSLTACGEKKESEKKETQEETTVQTVAETEAETQTAAVELPIIAEWREFSVSVLGAEEFKDSNDEPAIRIYYDFTNNSSSSSCAWLEFELNVSQEGYELGHAYPEWGEELEETPNDALNIRPGITVRCIGEYKMKKDGGPVKFEFVDFGDNAEAIATVEFDPKNLPGAPEPREIIQISEPEWTIELPDQGVHANDYYVFVDNADIVEGYEDEVVLRVYFEFTNNSDAATSFYSVVTPEAYQDGIGLMTGYPYESVPEDENYNVDVQPGETIRVTHSFELRTNSPVEVELIDIFSENNTIGAVYRLE